MIRILVPLVLIFLAIVLIIKTFKKKQVTKIEIIDLKDLCKIWIDNPDKEKHIKAKNITAARKDKDNENNHKTLEDIMSVDDYEVVAEDITNVEQFLALIRKKVNIINENNELDVISFNDSIYILSGTVLKITEELNIEEKALIAELIERGIAEYSYKLYKYFYLDSLKPDTKKTLVIRIDEWMEQYESRKDSKFTIKNIEEVIKRK